MPSMFNHERRSGWSSLASDEEGSDIDELAQFIAENDSETSHSVPEPLHIRVCKHLSSLRMCALNCLGRCNKRSYGIVLSIVLILLTTVICLGLGVTSMIPLPVIDISIEAFNIPNHIVYKRYNSFTYALKHNTTVHFSRPKRDLSSGAQYRDHSTDLWNKENPRDIFDAGRSLDDSLLYKSFKNLDSEDVNNLASKMTDDVGRRYKRHSTYHGGCIFGYQRYPRWKMQVIFLAKGDNPNMFTKERIEHVHHVEKIITSHPQFHQFCLKNPSLGQKDPAVKAQDNCAPLNSLMTYFYPTKDENGKIYYDGLGNNLDQVDSALKLAMNHETFYYYVDEQINKTYHHSKLLRTEVIFGAPLKGYCSRIGRDEQEDLYKKFIITYIGVLSKASSDKVQVLYGGNELFDYEVDKTFWMDVRMAYFTLGFIVLLMFILTSFSVWLTVWGMLSILLSFPLSLFFYRTIFHIDALGILNGAAAFVIIGIGVDDVFVFVNIFRQASHLKVHSTRILHTIKTAGKATFFTSFTTAAAFAANIASSIPAVSEFGLFMSLIVSSCWITVILIMPAALYLWVICFSKCEAACFRLFGCCTKHRGDDPIDAEQLHQGPMGISASLDDDVPMLHIENSTPSGNSIAEDDGDVPMLIPDPYTVGSQSQSVTPDNAEGFYLGSILQTLIGKYLATAIVKGRWIFIGFFGLLLVGSMGLMSQLRPATRPPQLFNPTTNLQQLLDLKANFTMMESLNCYRCPSLHKVTSTDPVTTASIHPPLPAQLPPTTPRPPPFTTMMPQQPMTSAVRITTSRTTSKPTRGRTTPRPTTTTRTTTTTTKPSTTTRKIHVKPDIPNHETPKPGSVDKDYNACKGQSCNNLKDRPNLRIGTKVFVVFGIKGIDRSGIQKGHVLNEDEGRTVFDPRFREQSTQMDFLKDLCRVCKLIAANRELVKKGSARCLPSVIPQAYLTLLKLVKECQNLPDSNSRSSVSLQAPISAVGGLTDKKQLTWLAFAFESTTTEGQSYFDAYKQYQKWEAFIQHIKETQLHPDSPLQDMFQASEFWKKVMMEVVAVSSAIYGLALSMVICIIAIAIFTSHLGLLFIVVITIIAMICLVVAIFYLAGWEMGAVEAISLSILVGSSVDYCVHLVEGYLIAYKYMPQNTDMTNSEIRKWRTSFALRHIGVAIISSAFTTIIAAIPLTQTTIQPFAKFGSIVLINTSVSILFTLLLCGALLTTIAPAKFKSSLKSSGIALVITVLVVGLLTLILFIISRTVSDIPGPGGDPLFPR